ncbi:NADH-cytochrome b5 reductase [Actinomortierella ambigua]|nr:NADH-cytochrome b5 reductase [Actinomortierella ambigua]
MGARMNLVIARNRMNSPVSSPSWATARRFTSGGRPSTIPPKKPDQQRASAQQQHAQSTPPPKPTNRTANMLTFLAATAIGIGAYVYQYQKPGSPAWNPFTSSTGGLNTERWTPILLKSVTKVSTHTSLFEFELPEPCEIPITSAIYIKDDQIQAMRAYTPIHTWPTSLSSSSSSADAQQQDPSASSEMEPQSTTTTATTKIQFLIKRYSEGQVSRFLHAARPGAKIEMRGPVVIWPASEPELDKWDEIGMIAGGTGVTAFLPIIHTALNSSTNRTRLTLVFAAREPEELYFKEELDQLAKKYPSRFKVVYTVDDAPEEQASSWQGPIGFVQRSLIEGVLPAPVSPVAATEGEAQDSFDNTSVILVCGPETMINHIAGSPGLSGRAPIKGLLGSMGYTLDQVVRFPN